MNCSYRRALAVAGSLALAGGAALASTIPASGLPTSNYSYGSQATGADAGGPNGKATATQTVVVNNVNVNGLLSTGTTTDTAGPNSTYAKVTYPLATTTWNPGLGTSYSVTVYANLAASYCSNGDNPAKDVVNIVKGVLIESSWVTATGVPVSYQVYNLPTLPSPNQTYSFGGATIKLAYQTPIVGGTETQAVHVTTPGAPVQTLSLAVVGCGTVSPSPSPTIIP